MNKNVCINYFLSRSLFLGTAFSLTFNISNRDTLLSFIIGSIIGIILILIINNIDFKKRKILQMITYIFFIFTSIITLETFISAFFLTNTPKIIIIIPTILLLFYASKKDINDIKNASSFLFLIAAFLSIVAITSLFKFMNLENLLPLFKTKTLGIVKSSLIYAILSASPHILLPQENKNDKLKGYLLASFINIFICVIVISSLTIDVAKTYSFPEYMILKRIKILGFIENIENILAALWFMDIYTIMILSFKRLRDSINNNFVFDLIIIFLTLFTTYFIVNNYDRVLLTYNYGIIFLGILLLLIIIKNKKNTDI